MVYILKSRADNITEKHEIVTFTANEANYGGAVYVSDDDMCALFASSKECVFQTLALYGMSHSLTLNTAPTDVCTYILNKIEQESRDTACMEDCWTDAKSVL